MSSTAIASVFGRDMKVHSVTDFFMHEDTLNGRRLCVEAVVVGHNGGLLHGVIFDADLIRIESREPINFDRARLSTGKCPICTNMFPFLCDTHRAERNN